MYLLVSILFFVCLYSNPPSQFMLSYILVALPNNIPILYSDENVQFFEYCYRDKGPCSEKNRQILGKILRTGRKFQKSADHSNGFPFGHKYSKRIQQIKQFEQAVMSINSVAPHIRCWVELRWPRRCVYVKVENNKLQILVTVYSYQYSRKCVLFQISAYIDAKQLKSAFLLAVKHKRMGDIRRIMREAEFLNQPNIKALCQKMLQTHSQSQSQSKD